MKPKIPGNVLVYTRHSNYGFARYFHEIAERTFAGEKKYCADWPGLEPVNLMKAFYKYFKNGNARHNLSVDDLEQITKRCPLLMTLPPEQARRMAIAMHASIEEAFDAARPDYIFSLSVDNYITDLLCRIALKRNAQPVMIINSPVDNRTRISRYGEFNKVRDPGEEEVEQVLEWLLDDENRCLYLFDFYRMTWAKHVKEYGLRFAKDLAFRAFKRYHRDPLNYRFSVGSAKFGYGKIKLSNYRFKSYDDVDWSDRLAAAKRPTIYMPLPQTPEATTTYWLKDLRYMDFNPFLLDACQTLARDYDLVIKDHWVMPGVRPWRFYRDLKSIPGLILVPAEVNSRDIYRRVNAILVGSGTSGIEAALRDRLVINLSEPYYFVKGSFLVLSGPDDIERLPNLIASMRPVFSREQQKTIVRRVLEGTIVGPLVVNKKSNDPATWDAVSNGFKDYLTTYGSRT
jgi:hypothetical protein